MQYFCYFGEFNNISGGPSSAGHMGMVEFIRDLGKDDLWYSFEGMI